MIELPNVRALCENEEAESIGVLRRDVEYAAFIHDWYRGTDPARLLTLASEWRLTISGQEWSNPRLLQGRLATTVLKKMYDAEAVLGQSRYGRITTMVENSVVGKPDQTVLTKLFFLAKVKAERDTGSSDWLIDRSQEPGFDINAAYLDTIERKKRGLWELGYVHAASNDSRAPTPTALPNSELGPEVQEPVSEYSHDLISRAR